MMKKDNIILIGAGGHSLSVLESIDENTQQIAGFIDEYKRGCIFGIPIYGSRIQMIPDYQKYSFHIAIGDVKVRKRWYDTIVGLGLPVVNIIDASASISETAKIGKGNYIGKQVIIGSGCIIGNNNLINSRALIEHESIVYNNTNISTNAVLNGDVIVKSGAFVGSMSVCNGQLTVGRDSVIGSGAVVTKSVPDGMTVVGIPARPLTNKGAAQNKEV